MAVKPPEPRPSGVPLVVTGLIITLGVIAVAIAIVLFNHTDPAPTLSPSGVGAASPTAARSTTPVASPTSVSPVATAPDVSPTIIAEPTRLPQAPIREVAFTALGIDNPLAPEASERRITFDVDGRGDISAEVSDISAGLVQMCLWPGDASTEPAAADCVVTPDSRIERTPTTGGPWTLLLAGAQPGRSPSVTLLLRFPASAAQVQLADFRFQGQDSPNYTGFDIEVTALADGEMNLTSAWDDGLDGSYPYGLTLLDLSVEFEEPIVVEGVSNLAVATRPVSNEHTYQVTMTNRQESVVEAVFLQATITWP
jgi:hypothetical protein